MNYILLITIAILCILYGIIKILLLSIDIFLSYYPQYNVFKDLPLIGHLYDNVDETIAGRFIVYILLIFSVNTFLNGLSMLNVINMNLFNVYIQIYLNFILGIITIIFYLFVIYTKIPIEKNINNIDNYKAYGLAAGFALLISIPILIFVLEYDGFLLNGLISVNGILLILLTIILLLIVILIMYSSGKFTRINNMIELTLIPLTSMSGGLA